MLEIGALHRPTLNPRDFNIKFADFTDTETLRKNYASMPGYNTDDIVNVDYIIGDGDYQSVFKQDKFDLVLGSHVGEHMPDFVGWLYRVYNILDTGGVLSLILPDKRYTFDFIRADTHVSEWIDNYEKNLTRPSSSQIYYHIFEHVRLEGANLWDVGEGITLKRSHTDDEAWEICRNTFMAKSYFDTHCSILTPKSFFRNLCRLEEAGLMPFELEALYDTEPNEIDFQVRLRRPPEGSRRTISDYKFNFDESPKYEVNHRGDEIMIHKNKY
ncbi:hypothetical protein [Methylorubrum thiocyanatum]|uniref:SAM-dependent methyltransferase n=1 Tax=Methylorubrum thiocyanatum TaxID=47958 RepID=A0AA40S8G5_9HYPH|nr:hypothetical protein [Methylorubrum thiocyanatum]MBA8916237.1 putative SAM-dependent methyltransferase [Methylorubrum thiocyanatum]